MRHEQAWRLGRLADGEPVGGGVPQARGLGARTDKGGAVEQAHEAGGAMAQSGAPQLMRGVQRDSSQPSSDLSRRHRDGFRALGTAGSSSSALRLVSMSACA